MTPIPPAHCPALEILPGTGNPPQKLVDNRLLLNGLGLSRRCSGVPRPSATSLAGSVGEIGAVSVIPDT